MSAAMVAGMSVLAACSPDKYEGLDYTKLPQASDIDVTISVDQETNQYTLTLNNQGYYPVWKIYTRATPEISTVNGAKGIIAAAGVYDVEVQIGNRHGVSEGSKTYQIVIENSIIDYTPYLRRLTGGESKTWCFASDKPGHLGCGEPGTDGLNWWSAQPNDKAGVGLYENRFIFGASTATDGGTYTYDPGTSGTVYVNTGITSMPPYSDVNPGDGNDYSAPAERQETTFMLTTEGPDLFLVLPQGTLLGYVPNIEIYNNPRFKVSSIGNDAIELIADNGAIAWHYILGPEGDAPFNGFKYDSEFNLWKKAGIGEPSYYYAPGWAQIANPALTTTDNSYTLSLPEATSDTWQCQFALPTDIATSAANNYDFSCIINPSKDHNNVTVKLVLDGDDGVYYFEEHGIKIAAGEDYVFWKHDMPGIDMTSVKLVFDFGGNEAGTDVTISNIVFKNAADDDGTKLPVIPDGPTTEWGATPNLWTGFSYTTSYYYAPGWAQIADPVMTDENGVYTYLFPEATSDQWQAQCFIHTDLTTSAEKRYDFRITLNLTCDHPGVTVKLFKKDHDDVFYMADRVKCTAFDDCTFEWIDMEGIDIDQLSLVLDFGGNAADCKAVVSGIILQEHPAE